MYTHIYIHIFIHIYVYIYVCRKIFIYMYMYINIYKQLCIYTSTPGEGTPSHPNESLAFRVLLPFVRVTLAPMGSKEGAHLTERGWKREKNIASARQRESTRVR